MIIRTSPRRSYTALPNAIFRDKRLSLDTKGLLAYMLSLPPSWQIRPPVIAKALSPEDGRPVGRDRLQRMFGELKAAGYMVRSQDQRHRDGGYWGSFSYIVGADPETVKQEVEAQGVAFLPQSALPSTAEPTAAEPSTANPATYKRKKDNNKLKIQTERSEFQYAAAALAEPQASGQPRKQGQILSAHVGAPKPNRVPNGDRGRLELEIAQRIGPDGFDVLMALSAHQVDQLCAQQRRGALDDTTLDRVRAQIAITVRT